MDIKPIYQFVGQLFNEDSFFVIPSYQRSYSWNDEQLDDFISDLKKCLSKSSTNHFLGGIVTIKKQIEGTSKTEYEVVDGQQRLTSVVLLVLALIKHYKLVLESLECIDTNFISKPLFNEITVVLQELEKKYIKVTYFDKNTITRSKLEPSKADKIYFKSLIANIYSSTTNNSNDRLKYGYDQLVKFIDEFIEFSTIRPLEMHYDLLNEKFNKLNSVVNILNSSMSIINIITENKSEAYKLFQTLNNRGLNLNVADLLKARSIELLYNYSMHQENVESIWLELADKENIEDFLKTMYFAETSKRPSKTSLYEDLSNHFLPQNIISIGKEEDASALCHTINKLKENYIIFNKISLGIWPYEDNCDKITNWHKNRLKLLIKTLNHSQAIPILILSCIRFDQITFYKIVNLLERYFFRFKVIFDLHAGSINSIYTDLCSKINDNKNFNYSDIKNILVKSQKNKTPEENFEENIILNLTYNSSSGNTQLKYLLLNFEEYYEYCKNATKNINVFMRLSISSTDIIDFDKISIEHISSQNPAIPNENFDSKNTHYLGNLSLLTKTDNERVKNLPYNKKQEFFIKSSFAINQYFNKVDVWDNTEFNNRQLLLVKYAQAIFDLSRDFKI